MKEKKKTPGSAESGVEKKKPARLRFLVPRTQFPFEGVTSRLGDKDNAGQEGRGRTSKFSDAQQKHREENLIAHPTTGHHSVISFFVILASSN